MTQRTFVNFASAVLALAGMTTTVSSAAHAQKGTYQPYEGAVTFTYDYATKAPGSPNSSVNFIGGSGSVAYYASSRVGFVADYSQVFKNNLPGPAIVGGPANLREATYLFGPRVAFPMKGRLTPYVQGLLGFTHDTGTAAQTSLFSGYGASQDYTHTTISFAGGAGVDFRVVRHLSIRLAQVEYVRTTLPMTTGKAQQDNVRVDSGLVVKF